VEQILDRWILPCSYTLACSFPQRVRTETLMSGLDVDAVLVRRFLGELDMWGLSVSGRRHSREALYYKTYAHLTESLTRYGFRAPYVLQM